MKLDTLRSLYIDELRDLYNAENQLLKALPKVAKAASSEELKEALEEHLEQTWGHLARIDQIFAALHEKPTGKTCYAMKRLIEKGSQILEQDGEPSVVDAGIIAAAQKVEHYEIAGYGTVRTFAYLLDEPDASGLLQQTLNEESDVNKILNEIAENIVKEDALEIQATAAGGSRRR
jgi:ferritin-like metal-binding protein YciE